MSRARFNRKPIKYDALQYDGDVQAVRDMGVVIINEEYKDVHVHVETFTGFDKACPIGHYIVRSDAGDVEVLSPAQFAAKYEPSPGN